MGRGLRVLKAFKADWFRPLNPIILRPLEDLYKLTRKPDTVKYMMR